MASVGITNRAHHSRTRARVIVAGRSPTPTGENARLFDWSCLLASIRQNQVAISRRSNLKRVSGGALLILAGLFLGREFLVWIVNRALDTLRAGIKFTSLSWLNGVALILVIIGGSLALWPSKKRHSASRTTQTPATSLANAAASIIRRVRASRSVRWHARDRIEPIDDIARASLSTLLTFEKAGFHVPDLNFEFSEQIAVGASNYFEILLDLLRHGHFEEALTLAPSACKQAESEANTFEPRSWFYNIY